MSLPAKERRGNLTLVARATQANSSTNSGRLLIKALERECSLLRYRLAVETARMRVRASARVRSPMFFLSQLRQCASAATRSVALASSAAVLAVACSQEPSPGARLPRPSYGPEDALFLDDSFSGHLFEAAFVPGVPGDDAHFEDRVRAAESIWLLKVATVSREGSLGNNRRYSVAFRTLESVVGPPPLEPVALTLSAKDPSFQWLDRVGGAWVGREVLLMVRSYQSGSSDTLHFHGEPNTPELRARILQIRRRPAAAEGAARVTRK